MNTARVALLLVGLVSLPFTIPASGEPESVETPMFRDAFTLHLRIDKDRYFEQRIGKVPYIAKNAIYLFNGDSFGAKLNIEGGHVTAIIFEPKAELAEVGFDFRQEVGADGNATMILTIDNRTKRTLQFKAAMVVVGRNGPSDTSIAPVHPELKGIEVWGDPIAQLVLYDLTITT